MSKLETCNGWVWRDGAVYSIAGDGPFPWYDVVLWTTPDERDRVRQWLSRVSPEYRRVGK